MIAEYESWVICTEGAIYISFEEGIENIINASSVKFASWWCLSFWRADLVSNRKSTYIYKWWCTVWSICDFVSYLPIKHPMCMKLFCFETLWYITINFFSFFLTQRYNGKPALFSSDFRKAIVNDKILLEIKS